MKQRGTGRQLVKGSGLVSTGFGNMADRDVVSRIHDMHKPEHEFWGWLSDCGWKRHDRGLEWELCMYEKDGCKAVFHYRANGNLTVSGNSNALMSAYWALKRNGQPLLKSNPHPRAKES
jgi:hypothetical protein